MGISQSLTQLEWSRIYYAGKEDLELMTPCLLLPSVGLQACAAMPKYQRFKSDLKVCFSDLDGKGYKTQS